MPKVVVGGKPQNQESGQVSITEAVQGKAPQVIPDTTNRQGAAAARTKAPEPKPVPAAAEKDKPVASAAAEKKPDETPAKASEVEESEPGDDGLPEGIRKRLAKLTVARKQADALVSRLKGDLEDAENFSKSQYTRAALAEEKAQELAREIESLKQAKPAAEKVEAPKKPDAQDVDKDGRRIYFDEKGNFKLAEYTEAVSTFTAQKAVGEERAKQESERKEAEKARVEAAKKAAQAEWEARVSDARKRYDDYDPVVVGSEVRQHNNVLAYITTAEHGADIAYYLAKNPDYAEKLNKLHPLKAIAEIGRLEIRWQKSEAKPAESETPAPARTGAAPAPISTLPGSGTEGAPFNPATTKANPQGDPEYARRMRDYERDRAAARRRR